MSSQNRSEMLELRKFSMHIHPGESDCIGSGYGARDSKTLNGIADLHRENMAVETQFYRRPQSGIHNF